MRYMTAGESHGPQLTAIVEGVPAGVKVSEDALNADMARRQAGYGRGGRQAIERDKARRLPSWSRTAIGGTGPTAWRCSATRPRT